MPMLSKTPRRLLTRVGGRPHATAEDHHPDDSSKNVITANSKTRHAKATEVVEQEPDLFADPIDLSDEETSAPEPQHSSHLEKLSDPKSFTSNRENKRPLAEHDDDDDEPIFKFGGSQQKRAKISSSAENGAQNRPRATKKYGSQASQTTASKTFKRSRDAVTKAGQGKSGFIGAKKVDTSPHTLQLATFKRIEIVPGASSSSTTSSPALSPLYTPPESPEVEILDLTSDQSRIKCAICQQDVDILLRQEYEDTYNEGQALSVRRQDAFCRYHKRHEARQLWKERGYPEINWNARRIASRMRKQHARLVKILHDESPSSFRDKLAAQIASRTDRSVKTAFGSSSQDTSRDLSAGYYGPQGQKVMLEHVSMHLAEELRAAALSSALIGSAGTGGGVSGYVQNVLVPEMAVGMIAEDMNTSYEAAMRILHESKTLGDLLHDELREELLLDES